MRLKTLFATAVAGLLATTAQAQDAGGTLQKIRDTGTITIGFRETSVPFSYLDDRQQPIGWAMDICHRIVDAVKAELSLPNVKIAYVPVTSATRIPLLANGTIDLECGSTTNNAERQRQVAYTNTHFLTASKFVSRRADNLTKIEDLRGKTVASTAGTTNIRQVIEANTARTLGLTVIPAKDHAEGFLLVETGRAAAFVMDDILLAGLIASARNPADFQISTDAFSQPEPYGVMLRRNDPSFKRLADAATAQFFRSPEGKAAYERWFQAPIPPRGLTLNVPMSAAMQRIMANPTDSPDPAAY